MPIRQLPRTLIDQIAAGEVVERPASAVKELVENALDAGARRIVVEIEGGGADLVRVSDDGSGIPMDELPLAVASHATSKIATAQDLARVTTLGFRGEALASIASVSRFSMVSRARGATETWGIRVEGGHIEPPAPAAGAPGTIVEVRQLFYNVPARRRFLRSTATETGRVQELLESVAISRPGVAFRLEVEGKVRLDLPATDDPRRRALAVLGEDLAEAMLDVDAQVQVEGGTFLTVWGVAGRPEVARSSGRALRLALNGRAVQDRTLLHAVKEAYRGLIDHGRTPVAYLAIEMDPSLVDVNVHPAKTEVRFRQSSLVHQLVMRAVREALRGADLVPGFALEREPSLPGHRFAGHTHVTVVPVAADGTRTAEETRTAPATTFPAFARAAAEAALRPPPVVEVAPLLDNRRARRVLQVHGTYLVVEDEQGILIIDQHALHERAMFEDLRERLARGTLESQRMLTPVTVPVEPRAAEMLDQTQPLLTRLGVDAAFAGPRTVAVHAFPTFLLGRKVNPGEFLVELLDKAADDGIPQDMEAALHTVLDMMACKAAIKAGDHLTTGELEALLDRRDALERASNCPHGRPTTLRITIRDLERQFGRA